MFVPNFKILGQVVAEKSLTEKKVYKLERKKNGQMKGLIRHMWLILYYTVQPVILDVFTKFQNCRSSSS